MKPTQKLAPGPRVVHGQFYTDPIPMMLGFERDYGEIVRIRLTEVTHLVFDPAAVKYVLQENASNYIRTHSLQRSLRSAIGNGLLVSHGPFWLRQRRLVQPAFSRERIAGFAKAMSRCGEEMADRWQRATASGAPIDVLPEFTALTLQILGLTLLNKDLGFAAAQLSEAVRILSDRTVQHSVATAHAGKTPDQPANVEFLEANAVIRRIADDLIAERRAGDADDHGDVLSMLMSARDPETGEAMGDEEISVELMHLITAGHETTSVAFAWICYAMARYPESSARIREELDRVLGGRTPTFDDVPKLVHLRASIDESLRLYPPLWLMMRRAIEDDYIGDYYIPAGSSIYISQYVTHRLARLWPDPEAFRPERFLTPDPQRQRFAYFPFAGGPHLCVGNHFALLELTLVMAVLCQRFDFGLVPDFPISILPGLSLRPRDGILVNLRAVA